MDENIKVVDVDVIVDESIKGLDVAVVVMQEEDVRVVVVVVVVEEGGITTTRNQERNKVFHCLQWKAKLTFAV